MTNESIARELVQDIVDDWKAARLPADAMADALDAHAAHLRSGAEEPLVAPAFYLDSPEGKEASAAFAAHAAEMKATGDR